VSNQIVKEILALMKKTGAIELKNNKYKVISTRLTLITSKQTDQLKEYWISHALETYRSFPSKKRKGPDPHIFSYNIFSASDESWRKIIKLYSKFYSDLRDILSSEKPNIANSVRAMTTQFIDLTSGVSE